MNKDKILITGKTGTVGRNLPFGQGFPSSVFDLRDKAQTEALFDKINPDGVIHLAARVGGLGYHLNHKYDLYYDNITINTNVIDTAKRRGVKRVLSYLSSCIFSEDSEPPYTEDMVFEGSPFLVHRPYGVAKRALHTQSEIIFEESGLTYNCVIPTNIFGLNDEYSLQDGHIVGNLIHKAFRAAQDGGDFVVWGDGSQERNLIFTEDIVKLTEWAFFNYLDKEPLILSNNEAVKVGDLAVLIANYFNVEDRIVFDTSKPMGQKIRHLSGEKLKTLTNFQFTPLDQAIEQSCSWFVDNYPNVRL